MCRVHGFLNFTDMQPWLDSCSCLNLEFQYRAPRQTKLIPHCSSDVAVLRAIVPILPCFSQEYTDINHSTAARISSLCFSDLGSSLNLNGSGCLDDTVVRVLLGGFNASNSHNYPISHFPTWKHVATISVLHCLYVERC